MDETSSWKCQIDHTFKTNSSANYIVEKAKNVLLILCLMTLYQSLIQCHINYGLEAWESSKLLKSYIRTINKNPYNDHT